VEVVNHLAFAAKSGLPLDLSKLVKTEEIKAIKDSAKELKPLNYQTLRKLLGPEISDTAIKLVLASEFKKL
jgi:hypothetical protein